MLNYSNIEAAKERIKKYGNSMQDKRHSEETKQKISESKRGKGKPLSEEAKKLRKENFKGRPKGPYKN